MIKTNKLILISALIITQLTSCNKSYLYDPNDNLYISSFANNNQYSLILFDTEFWVPNSWKEGVSEEKLHTHFLRVEKNNEDRVNEEKSYSYLYDLVNYPKIDKFYGLPDPFPLRGYVVEPGTYFLAYCKSSLAAEGRPNYCPAHEWKLNGNKIGYLFFKVEAGEIVNLGKIKVTWSFDEQTAFLEVMQNSSNAEQYMIQEYPNIASKLEHRPFWITKADVNHQKENYRLPPSALIPIILQNN